MQYKLLTDCAVKALWFLAEDERKKASTYDLAEYIGMSRTTVQNIMRTLRRNTKWIKSFAGTEGGYHFVGDAVKITLYDIHRAMEDEMRVGEIVTHSDIMLGAVYNEFVKNAKEYFSCITLKDLLECRTAAEVEAYIAGPAFMGGGVEKGAEMMALRRQMDKMREDYEAEIRILSEERDKIRAEHNDMYNKVRSIMSNIGRETV